MVAEVFVPGPKQPLNAPYGGKLVNVMASPQRAEEVITHHLHPCACSIVAHGVGGRGWGCLQKVASVHRCSIYGRM